MHNKRMGLCGNLAQDSINNKERRKRRPLSYSHNIGLNLNPQEVRPNDATLNSSHILKKVNINNCKEGLAKYEELIPSSAVRPQVNQISFDSQKIYKYVLNDIETASAARNTELLELSAVTDDAAHSFSKYILATSAQHKQYCKSRISRRFCRFQAASTS